MEEGKDHRCQTLDLVELEVVVNIYKKAVCSQGGRPYLR
jgi:hypothetical protein